MLYYLGMWLRPEIGPFNVLSYHTVRAGGAAITGFLFCLIAGPFLIRWLRAVKAGQYIKQDHVEDLHALHKTKAGTPTMGGMLILVSTLLSVALWSTLTNPLMWTAVGVMLVMGAVGFVDDYTKLKRKHNAGLSAKAKMLGQLLAGSLLGAYVILNPIALGSTYLNRQDVTDWPKLVKTLRETSEDAPLRPYWDQLAPGLQYRLRNVPLDGVLSDSVRTELHADLNRVLESPELYDAARWQGAALDSEAQRLIAARSKLSLRERVRLNRILLETAAPDCVPPGPRNIHTQVEVPGLKNVFIPLGLLYVVFVIFVLVGTSNAVNLTDGLDGLAAGTAIISLLAYTGIAYVVSRADWSRYLLLTYVPEASELTVFGAAMLGAGLGFLWFNAHPAEVFMGDTGSLGLGGALGAMAVLTKQELLLPIVAGLFVLETLSVMIQVASFKMTGKRVFKMAPLHHHFELSGWSETKVTVRFWIIAILFALLSLGTLKLR